MEAKTLVSRLKKPYQLIEDTSEQWSAVAKEYPFFAHAQFLSYAQQKLEGKDVSIRSLSPFKQNPIKMLQFLHRIDHPETGSETLATDTWEDAHSMLLDEGSPEKQEPIMQEAITASTEISETQLAEVEDMVTEQSNAVDDVFDVEASIQEKEELHEVALVETEIENIPETAALPDIKDDLSGSEQNKETANEVIATHENKGVDLMETDDSVPDDKSLMVMMSFMDWLHHFRSKTQAEQEEEREKKALKTAWQKEKLSAIVEEEEEEIPENIFKQAMESISLETTLISESLAKLLAKQGKTDKAIEMYKKLSLRNPEKSAYFADLIKEIHLNNN